jgi:crossover junction endodeoxyribonuclease RusA
MLPFEFTIKGPPLSHQTSDKAKLRVWRESVTRAARNKWPVGERPASLKVQFHLIYFHEGDQIRLDGDNLVKPIQDALNGLVYLDDRQITKSVIEKWPIDGPFKVRRMSSEIANGLVDGEEFLYVRVEEAPAHGEFGR